MTELTEHVNFEDDPVCVRTGGVDLTLPVADDYNEPTYRENQTVQDLEWSDQINSPAHYAEGRSVEVIDAIEDAVIRAPDPVVGGLQWQTLKYLNRMWDKESALKDALKAQWYLKRLINKLGESHDS